MLQINARAIPGTRYLARSWPTHVVSPISLVWPLEAHTTYVCVAWYSGCWNALTSRPLPYGFRGLRQERSFTLERSPGNALTRWPLSDGATNRLVDWFEFEAEERGARQRYFWSPTCGPVGQLIGATKGIIMGVTSVPYLVETGGHTDTLIPRR